MKDERLPNRSSKSSFARLSRAICRHRPLLPPRHYSILEGSTFLSPQIPFYFARLSSQETSVRWRENEKIALIGHLSRVSLQQRRLTTSNKCWVDEDILAWFACASLTPQSSYTHFVYRKGTCLAE